MFRLDAFISWFVSAIVIFFIFYGAMLFLPVLLLIVCGYIIYQFVRFWWLQRTLKKSFYSFDISEEKSEKDKVIDAEFEILNEKTQK